MYLNTYLFLLERQTDVIDLEILPVVNIKTEVHTGQRCYVCYFRTRNWQPLSGKTERLSQDTHKTCYQANLKVHFSNGLKTCAEL